MTQSTEERVMQLISQLKTQWDDLVVEYEYDAQDDVWDIWHFNYELQYNDMNFQKLVGKLIRALFFDQGTFNISFGYKHITDGHVFTTGENTSISFFVTTGNNVPVNWLISPPNRQKTSLEGITVNNIYGYLQHSDLLNNYNFNPGTNENMSIIISDQEEKGLAA